MMIQELPKSFAGRALGADRWNFILPTERGLATKRGEILKDAVTVVVKGAIVWTKKNHADVWACDGYIEQVASFPPGLAVWGAPESEAAFRLKGIPFVVLKPNAVLGPGKVPRPADAFFKAIAFACEALRAKKVRVFGSHDWKKPDVRWQRWALTNIVRTAGKHGIEIERVG